MPAKTTIRSAQELEQRRSELEDDTRAYLRATGWKWTCDTPCALWLWSREHKGRTLLVTEDVALRMQAEFEDVGL